MMQPTIQLNNPCPMRLSRMEKSKEGFHCGSCNSKVLDFTSSSDEEIKQAFQNGAQCGVFSSEQVGNPLSKKAKSYKVFFHFLVLFSFLGFSVNPISAQGSKKNHAKKESVKENRTSKYYGDVVLLKDRKKEMKKFRKHQNKRRKKHPEFRSIGCPSF